MEEFESISLDDVASQSIYGGSTEDSGWESATGCTASWTTTYDWPSIADDSTTTDEYSYSSYTSDTKALTSEIYEGSECDQDNESDGLSTRVEIDSDQEETSSHISTVVESTSSRMRSDDTDYLIRQLPDLLAAGEFANEVQMRRYERPRTSPVIGDQRSKYNFESTPVSLDKFPDHGDNCSDQSIYPVPKLSSSWWRPRPKVHLGITYTARPKYRRRFGSIRYGHRWTNLFHLRVLMSTVTVKREREEFVNYEIE